MENIRFYIIFLLLLTCGLFAMSTIKDQQQDKRLLTLEAEQTAEN